VIFGNICQLWHHLATLVSTPSETSLQLTGVLEEAVVTGA